ncbi:MAG: hypothetical protein JKY31_04270 [Rhodobacteraceae bacterium]|nr:hypothetical protein [Paracoccaceae bacterium]
MHVNILQFGAVFAAAFLFSSNFSLADDTKRTQGGPTVAIPKERLHIPYSRVSKSRPYHYLYMNTALENKYPGLRVSDVLYEHRNKFIILNFLHVGFNASKTQSILMRDFLKALYPVSGNKELMLIDVVAGVDGERTAFYRDYEVYYSYNTLGPRFSKRKEWALPYTIVDDGIYRESGKPALDYTILNTKLERYPEPIFHEMATRFGERLYELMTNVNGSQ